MKELTIEELKQMAGQPVWCPEEEAYGIVMCDKIGQWAGIPFLHGVWYSDDDGVGVEFNHNIIGRKLKCFRIEDRKEIAMPLRNKEIGFAVTNTLEAQKPKTEAQPQAQGINPAALLAAMFANAANQQPRDDTGNESDDDE